MKVIIMTTTTLDLQRAFPVLRVTQGGPNDVMTSGPWQCHYPFCGASSAGRRAGLPEPQGRGKSSKP